MLEVVFGDSAKGSLKCAMNYHEQEWLDGPSAYIGEQPSREALKRIFAGHAVGGNPDDVVGLSLLLDVGDISGSVCSEERENVIFEMFGHAFKDREDPEFLRFLQQNKEDLQRILDVARVGGEIRVWHGNEPQDACGFRYLMWELRKCDCRIWEVPLPRLILTEDGAVEELMSWGSVSPGKFCRFLDGAREVDPMIRRKLVCEWAELVEENAPLRAVVNGRVMSVPEEFYDHLLWECMPEGEFRMAMLIGNVLGKYDFGVGDWWYAYRIRRLIDEGKLMVADEGDRSHPYAMMLRKI